MTVPFRIGIGYDLHRLEENRPLILGGVLVPHPLGLTGHSDADVLTHAIIDALLGAAALGNIGRHFPDTDPKFKGADSMVLLDAAVSLLREAGYAIVNVDANIVAQQPKLNPYLDSMCATLAEHLGVEKASVSVKAKTNEHVGPEGRCEAISAQAVALITCDEQSTLFFRDALRKRTVG